MLEMSTFFCATGCYFKYQQYAHSYRAASADLARESILPKIMGESIYAAITCSGSSIAASHLFSEKEPVFLGRISVKERKCRWDRKGGSWEREGGERICRTITTYHENFNTHLICEKNGEIIGPVEAQHLDVMEWQGKKSLSKTYSNRQLPKDPAAILKYLQIQISDDHGVEYVISKEWYEKNKVFIFADVKKTQNGYEINKPGNQPFILTVKSDKEFVQEARDNAECYRICAWVCLIASGVLFINEILENFSPHGSTALIQAIKKDRGYAQALIKISLLFQRNLNIQGDDRRTALIWAIEKNQDKIVQILTKALVCQNADFSFYNNEYYYITKIRNALLDCELRNNPGWVLALNEIVKEYLGADN